MIDYGNFSVMDVPSNEVGLYCNSCEEFICFAAVFTVEDLIREVDEHEHMS